MPHPLGSGQRGVCAADGFQAVRQVRRQWRDPAEPRIRFEHIGGFTRGMQVAWTFERHDDGRVTVRIDHEFKKGWPVLDRFVSERIVGSFFVSAIAGKTLARVKLLAERERTSRQLAGHA